MLRAAEGYILFSMLVMTTTVYIIARECYMLAHYLALPRNIHCFITILSLDYQHRASATCLFIICHCISQNVAGFIVSNSDFDFWPNAKFLGVIVDKHLNWKVHITMISQKLYKSSIDQKRYNLDIKSKELIYYGLIHPYAWLTASMYGLQHIKLT